MNPLTAPQPTVRAQERGGIWRIYYLHPLLAAPDALMDHLDRCVAMGFDTVLIPPPFRPGASGSLFLSADHAALHPALGENSADRYVGMLAAACRARGLSLYLDLVLDRLAVDGVEPASRPEWFDFAEGEGSAPDPRKEEEAGNQARVRFDVAAVARAMTDWWTDRIGGWIASGVGGFRCEGVARVPRAVWRETICLSKETNPECRFLAWTPGLAAREVDDLAGIGFDAVFSSIRWWNFRDPWLLEEHRRQRRIAPAIAFPEEPFGARLANEIARPDERLAASRRALWLSAFAGDGLLVPMGFEFGASAPLDPARGDPAEFARLMEEPPFDLTTEIAEANQWLGERATRRSGALLSLASESSDVVALLRSYDTSPEENGAELALLNPDLHRSQRLDPATLLPEAHLMTLYEPVRGDEPLSLAHEARLAPGEIRIFAGRRPPAVVLPGGSRKALEEATGAPRIAIEDITPSVDGGRFPVKRIVGERVTVEADIFSDGHDELGARLLWRAADETEWRETPMALVSNDRWRAEFPLERLGTYLFAIEAWRDDFATLRVRLRKKQAAGVSLRNEIEDARAELAVALPHGKGETATFLKSVLDRLESATNDAERAGFLLSDRLAAAMAKTAPKAFLVRHPVDYPVWAERLAARYGAWYELFPRSQSGDPKRHGTFDDVIARLPAIRDMGFDVLYMPPIHPIGRKNRKGRNNALTAEPGDPGSPYAIGAAEGGHTAIHPELGTLEDFRRLRDAAKAHGLELALDFAIQCSTDHPWLREHPDWFRWQSDGTLRYAENPPKTYEDITNVEFYAEGAVPDLWLALESVVLFWIVEGVRIFRVDNPHTKPYPFWEWLIGNIRARHPDAIFLSEAFTAPKRMYRLAKLGFSQSYTYFTWRHGKTELTDYVTELDRDPVREFFRPHFFVNTPDINPHFLQTSGRPGHLIRAALATLLSGLWGMYNGFELCEATPLPGREEYLDSEKYEIRAWDWSRPGNIVAEIAALNRIRRENHALHSHLGTSFYNAFNDQILYFARATPRRENVVLAAISLDPWRAHEAAIELPLWEWGLPDDAALAAKDLMRGHEFTWHGKNQIIRLDPELPFAVWRVAPAGSF